VLNNQTRVLEALPNAINRPRPRGQGMNEKPTDFLRTKPPTFGGSSNPLDADDWLRVIQRKLETFGCENRDKVLLAAHQLTGTALAWWENYCAAADDATTITWEEFVDDFRHYHVPVATIKRKAEEFVNCNKEPRQWKSTPSNLWSYLVMPLKRSTPMRRNKIYL